MRLCIEPSHYSSGIIVVLCARVFFVWAMTCSLILHCVHNYAAYCNVVWSLMHTHTLSLSRLPSLWHADWERRLVMLPQQGFPSEMYERGQEGSLCVDPGDKRWRQYLQNSFFPKWNKFNLGSCWFYALNDYDTYLFICLSCCSKDTYQYIQSSKAK